MNTALSYALDCLIAEIERTPAGTWRAARLRMARRMIEEVLAMTRTEEPA